MDLLIDHAKKRYNTQFIFLTPQDTSTIMGSDNVKIHRFTIFYVFIIMLTYKAIESIEQNINYQYTAENINRKILPIMRFNFLIENLSLVFLINV